MNNWENIYQSVNQAQQMNFIPMNNMQLFNPMMKNMNNPMDQIQNMSAMLQNQQNLSGGNQNFFNNMNQNNKYNLVFSTLKGARINMTFNADETIDGVLTKFLKRVNLDYLIKKIEGKLSFIMSAESLKFGDTRKLRELMILPSNFLTVFVQDMQDLIGAVE